MQAWEFAADMLRAAEPVVLSETEQSWDSSASMQQLDFERRLFWDSHVPSSGAPECLMAAALQSLENKGFRLAPYESLLRQGLAAVASGDMEALHVADMRLRALMRAARPDPAHPSQRTLRFSEFAAFDAQAAWPDDVPVDVHAAAFEQAMTAAWMGQLVGAAAGTAIEGYTMERLAAATCARCYARSWRCSRRRRNTARCCASPWTRARPRRTGERLGYAATRIW